MERAMAFPYPPFTGTEPCTRSADPDAHWYGCDDDHPGRAINNPELVAYTAEHCATCPLLQACMRYAVTQRERFGVWGATRPADREIIRRMPDWPAWDPVQRRWQLTPAVRARRTA